jgi:hypothetical protein
MIMQDGTVTSKKDQEYIMDLRRIKETKGFDLCVDARYDII